MPLSVPFPTLRLTRDVEIKDWTKFLACLPEQHGAVTEAGDFERYVDEIAWRRKNQQCELQNGTRISLGLGAYMWFQTHELGARAKKSQG
jgi:hypothetical protein